MVARAGHRLRRFAQALSSYVTQRFGALIEATIVNVFKARIALPSASREVKVSVLRHA